MWQKIKNRKWMWLPISIAFGFVPLAVSQVILNTLYTIIGIMFGIGFSLIISSVYHEVGNTVDRQAMRGNVRNIRDLFFFYFVVSSVCYVITSIISKENMLSFFNITCPNWNKCTLLTWWVEHYHLTMTTMIVFVIVIAVFLRNYLSLQKLNEDIDEELAH